MTFKKGPSTDYTKSAIVICSIFAVLLIGSRLFGSSSSPSAPPVSNAELESALQTSTGSTVSDGSGSNKESTISQSKEEQLALIASQAQKVAAEERGETQGTSSYNFDLCPDKGVDFIPCLDNEAAIKTLKSRKHYEHRERHCPAKGDDAHLNCLLPLPPNYKKHVPWPESRDQIWFDNVPHPSLANYKADQNWVKAEGQKFVFPGGGTQFKYGATKYIEWLQDSIPNLTWGKHVRVALDMGCGVASFAAYLEPFSTRVMSVAPKDEHEAQIQFALERGVSALVGVMGTMRQPYPSNVYDIVHCARCRVPWHREGGKLLLELNRLIRPGGYFVWSATPVCPECKAKEPDDKEIWEAMSVLTEQMCWKRVAKVISLPMGIGVAVFQKPTDNTCYDSRPKDAQPPMCPEWDNPDAAWYVPMEACMHRIPENGARGTSWPPEDRSRWTTAPAWLKTIEKGGKKGQAEKEFKKDTEHWERVVKSYDSNIGIDWASVRNVMDVDAHYGGFAAALTSRPMWTMNVVPISSPDTLPIIFERGLLGVYHDWCESFNTYPRTYDLIHVDHFLGQAIKSNRCDLEDIMLEFDRILRPGGFVVVRETSSYASTVKAVAAALHWEVKASVEEGSEVLISYEKTMWRPQATA